MKLEHNIIRSNTNNIKWTAFKYIVNVTILDYRSFVALLSNISAWPGWQVTYFSILSAFCKLRWWSYGWMWFSKSSMLWGRIFSCHKMVKVIKWHNENVLLFSCTWILLIYNLREIFQPAGKNKNTQWETFFKKNKIRKKIPFEMILT